MDKTSGRDKSKSLRLVYDEKIRLGGRRKRRDSEIPEMNFYEFAWMLFQEFNLKLFFLLIEIQDVSKVKAEVGKSHLQNPGLKNNFISQKIIVNFSLTNFVFCVIFISKFYFFPKTHQDFL